MNIPFVLHSLIMVAGVFIASLAQVLLKSSALKEHNSIIKEYLNWRVIVGYGMMFISTIFSVYAYKVIPISLAVLLDSTGYIFVTCFGLLFLKEKVTKQRLFALILILLGIGIYALLG